MRDTVQWRGVYSGAPAISIDVDVVRQWFPSPSVIDSDEELTGLECGESKRYCVGGALILSLQALRLFEWGYDGVFPHAGDLMDALRVANPRLNQIRAMTWAGAIIRRNDRKDFEGAWMYLDKALTLPRVPEIGG